MRRLNPKILVPAALVAALLAGCTATADAADSTDGTSRTRHDDVRRRTSPSSRRWPPTRRPTTST